MSKELEAKVNGLYNSCNDKYDISYVNAFKDGVDMCEQLFKQALSTPTSDEIVKELNELYKNVTVYDYFTYDYKLEFNEQNTYQNITYSKEYKNIQGLDGLPIKLAHKITTFFMEVE